MEHRWNESDRGKPRYSGKNLSQCHFVQYKSHMDGSGMKPGPSLWEPVTNRLSHDTALLWTLSVVQFLKKHDVSEAGCASLFRQRSTYSVRPLRSRYSQSSDRLARSKRSIRVGALLSEERSRAGFRNAVTSSKIRRSTKFKKRRLLQ